MEEALSQVQAKDTKERMAGVEILQTFLEQRRKGLSASEVSSIVEATRGLLTDNNFRVCQGALQALASASALAGEHLKVHFNVLLPAIVECLGDAKQPVRDAAHRLLLALMEISSPTIIVERAGSTAWTNRNWRVREEFVRTMAAAINLFAATEITLQRFVLPPVLQLVSDPNTSVREASMQCLEEMHRQVGSQFRDELQRQSLPASQVAEIIAKLERSDPKAKPFESLAKPVSVTESKSSLVGGGKRNSPRGKPAPLDVPSFAGDIDSVEQPVDPIKMYSEKELTKEIDKIAATLTQDHDWSLRMAAMQRVEGLLYGGAGEFPSFPALLKQLTGPLGVQLSDRRSSIVKQACHLLNTLSRELPTDFEPCVESFIPVLFKLVVITVQVIAESADTCIKTMLRNCRVGRMLPKIADIAKNDRNGVLRARSCEYILLILEQWPDAPEVQRAAEVYEELIRCCVGDAMSEVRSTARSCYRLFAKTWPERSNKLFMSFDPAIQRLINDEERGFHKRYSSPSSRSRAPTNPLRNSISTTPTLLKPSTPQSLPIVAMDRRASFTSTTATTTSTTSERSLESILQASQQRVSAIESMLRGVELPDKSTKPATVTRVSPTFEKTSSNGSSRGVVDLPSSRDPPFPASASSAIGTSSLILSSHYSGDSLFSPHSEYNGGVSVMDRFNWSSSPLLSSNEGKRLSRSESHHQHHHQSHHHHQQRVDGVPGFQRPLLRNSSSGRSPSATRTHSDSSSFSYGTDSNNGTTAVALSEVINEGMGSNADWSARVGAFNGIRDYLQEGSKGVQEVTQYFDKVMKLFFAHLDDPHHKVAQAALSTLGDIISLCRKTFECYLERILPHVFSRLVDPKEIIRQLSGRVLEIVATSYSIESLLPALLRSLDEQRSLKAKIAIIDFANSVIGKLQPLSGDGGGGSGLMRLWLAKITPLAHDKNPKLKDVGVNGIISIYTHYDPSAVLNFIINLSIEEQNILRRVLKQYTPRIEVDVVALLQNKHHQRTNTKVKAINDGDDDIYAGGGGGRAYSALMRCQQQQVGSYSSGSFNSDVGGGGGKKWSSMQSDTWTGNGLANDALRDSPSSEANYHRRSSANDSYRNKRSTAETPSLDKYPLEQTYPDKQTDVVDNVVGDEVACNEKESISDIPSLLHEVSNGEDVAKKSKALNDLIMKSRVNESSSWSQYFNQILTAVCEALDESEESIRELSLTVVSEMLNNQRVMIEESTEILVEKLLHASKDNSVKVANAADNCLTKVLMEFDEYRCLSVVVPLLVSEDVKTLVTCITCLTKLVGRLRQEELMEQLPSFLPALFDAFGNQSAEVRKTVVFCLVDIYIALGKAFVPYLSNLSSNQLKLVTIYANRISQARTGNSLDAV